METLSDFIRRQAQEQRTNTIGAAEIVLDTIEVTPDDMAGDLQLADEFSKTTGGPTPPAPMVREYRNEFQKEIERRRNGTILTGAPRLADWVRDPVNAALAKDALSELSWFEGFGRGLSGTAERAAEGLSQMGNQFMFEQAAGRAADRRKSFGELVEDQKLEMFDMEGNRIDTGAGPIEYMGAFARWIDARYADLIGTDGEAAAAEFAGRVKANTDAIRAIPKSQVATEFEAGAIVEGATFGEALANFGSAFLSNPVGGLSWALETAGESAPQLLAAMGTTLLTRNPFAGAAVGAGGSYLTERYRSPAEFFEENKIDLSKPEDVQRLLSDPKLMEDAANRGVIRGLVIGAFDALSMGVAGRSLAGNPLVEAIAQGASQAILGSAGEYSARVAAGQEIDWNEVIAEGLAELATTPIDMGIAGRKFVRQRRDAEKAEETRAKVEEVMGAAGSSVLRNRMPDKFREFLERATDGSEVESVFIDSERFVEYFQDMGVDPFAIADTLEGVGAEELRMATVSGGDVKIPVATLATVIPGSGHEAFFIEQSRFDPDAMSPSLAAEFNERVEELRQEAFELAEELRLEEERSRSFEREIYDTMVSELRAAGRSTNEATTAAGLWVSNYRTAAEDEGMTLDEYMARYPLPKVRGEIPQGMQARDVDALTRTLAEARSRRSAGLERRGPSLLEFISDYGGINDPGGELRARDAAVIKRGRGKKTLRLARGGMSAVRDMFGIGGDGKRFGLDDVAFAAIEAGYMADDPVIREFENATREGRQVPEIGAALLAAIDRELSGEAQYSSHVAVDEDAIQTDETLDQIEEYLGRLGVDLNDSDDVIRAAVEADQDERRREFAQASRPQDISAGPYGRTMLLEQDREFWSKNWRSLLGDQKARQPVRVLRKNFVLEALTGHKGEVKFAPKMAQSIAAKHPDVPESVWRNLPELLADPDFVYPYNDETMNFVIDATTAKGEPIIVGVRDGEVHTITPRHDKPDEAGEEAVARLVNAAIKRGNRVYVRDAGVAAALEPAEQASDGKKPQRQGAVSEGANLPYASRTPDRQSARRLPKNVITRDAVVNRVGRLFYQGDGYVVGGIRYAVKPPKKLYRGTVEGQQESGASGLGTAMLGRGLYTSRSKSFAKMYATNGKVEEVPIEAGWPRNPLVLHGTGGAPSLLNDWIFRNTEYRNIREFNKDWSDPAEFVKSKGYDGVIAGDEVVRYPDVAGDRILYQGPRGSIQFPLGGAADGETIINLFQYANLSTFLHESGHYFLANLVDRAAQGSTVAQDRMAVVREWWRSNADAVAKDAMRAVANVEVTTDDVNAWLDNGTTGDASKDMAIDTGAHEQWARGFEQYLMEGKAPSIELRSAFEKFRAWLISVYRHVAGLNVNVSDDLRAVFDRMLATDVEIAKANERSGSAGPVFTTAEAMGLTEAEYEAFLKLRSQSEDEAKARLLAETMAPIKREQEKWFKDERAKVREEVEREVNAYRQYRAIEWMGNRRWLGEGRPEGMPDMRMSKDILVQRYGSGILKTLPRGQQTVYAVDGGLDPDDAAAWFGFASGDEMVRAMETAPHRNEAIEAETDKRMRDLHGDVLHDGSVELEALDAIHSVKRGDWIAAELKAIAEVAGVDVAVTAKEARHTARQTIARMRVRDAMNANRFLAAERKAAEEAAALGRGLARERVWMDNARRRIAVKARAALRGDVTVNAPARQIEQANRSTENYNTTVGKLIEAKRRQLMNHALYMEARKVADEVEKAERFVGKLGSRKHREKIAGAGRRDNATVDYLAAIDELLERYDFRRMSGRAEDRRGALNAFIEAMRAAGRENELAIPAAVLEPGGGLSRPDRHAKAMRDAGRIPYKTLPVEELRGVIDSLKNIEHVALRWNEFIVNQKKREFTEAATAIADAIRTNVKGKSVQWVKQAGIKEGARMGLSGYLATIRTATTILRKLDGREDLGPTYELLKSDLDAAAYRELEMSREAADKLRALYALYSEDEQREMGVAKVRPELRNRSFSKWNLIAMALNMGNEGNLARLTNDKARFHLRDDEVEAVKTMLDDRDARFVQGVWDLINSYRPEIAKRDRRVKGVEPEWVEPMPVTIGGVDLPGGYYPIKYDGRHGGGRPSAAESDNDILASIMGGGYASAHTKDGHLKARGAHVRQSLLLDTSVITRHLNEVIHDLTHSEAIVNTWKLLSDSGVERAFLDADLQDPYRQLKLWVQDAATGQVGSGSQLAQAMTYLRGGFAYSKLAFSFKTALLQPLGVMQSAVAVGKKRMALHMLRTMRHPIEVSSEVVAKSKMMRMRRDTFNKDLMDAAAQSNIASPAGNRARAFMDDVIIPLGMAGMVYTQYYTVDVPTWTAAYEKAMDQFNGDDAKAVQYADMTVQRSQGSGIWTDRSAIERGTLSGSMRQNPFVTLLTTLGSYFFAKMNMAIERTDQLRSEPVTLQSAMNYGLDMSLLFVGEALVIALLSSLVGGGDDDDDKSLAGEVLTESAKTLVAGLPVVRDAAGALQGFDAGTYGAILKVFTNPIYQASQGDVDKALVKSTINLVGMVGRLPSAQVNRVVDAAWRQAEGEDVSPAEYLLGRHR